MKTIFTNRSLSYTVNHRMYVFKQLVRIQISVLKSRSYAVFLLQILDELKRVNFTTRNGIQVSFDSNGDPVAVYELINWQIKENGSMDFITVGVYDSSKPRGQEFTISRNISWVGGQTEVRIAPFQ